jgi:phenylacetate-CoA ligase
MATSDLDLSRRLPDAMRYAYERSPYYRERFDALGLRPEEIRSERDLEQLPVMLDKAIERRLVESSSARAGHPFGEHLCADPDEVVGICTTSGTTGDPTFYPFTADDIELMDRLWARAFRFCGLRAGDRVLHAFGLSMFLAGVPVVRALERMGACPIPVGAEAGADKLHRLAVALRPRALCCTPSYADHLIERFDMATLGIELIFCAGEPGAGLPEVRGRLEDGFGGAHVFDLMGGGKGMMNVSCPAHAGMHMLAPEHSVIQLVDPASKEPIPLEDGAVGERVMTTLSWRAAPWVRATIGDLTEVRTTPCPCGDPSPRMSVVGRVDDMLIVKGAKIYPSAIQGLVGEFAPRLPGHFRILLDSPPPKVTPPLQIEVEVAEGVGEDVLDELAAAMRERLGVTPRLSRVAAGTLPRGSHKQRWIEVVSGAPEVQS